MPQDTTNATPRPWRAGYLGETDRKERMVIRAERVDGQPYVAICPAPIVGSHEANATLIVQAVNRYPALHAAAQTALRKHRAEMDMMRRNNVDMPPAAAKRLNDYEQMLVAALAGQAPEPPNALLLSTLKLARAALTATMQAGAGYDWNADPRYITLMQGEAVRAIDAALALGGQTTPEPQPDRDALVRALGDAIEETRRSGQLSTGTFLRLTDMYAALGGARAGESHDV